MAELIIKKPSTKVIDTWKMKKWYKLVSPQLFGSHQIGETIAVEDSQLIGRTVNVSLAIVTGDSKKQSTNAIFEINEVKNGSAETKLKKMEISQSSIRRMIRKGKDRIDLSLICATKDNVIVRVKPFMVTRAKVGGSAMTNMRRLLDALLRVEINKISYENLIRDVVSGRLQRTLKQRINKIYPIKISEIRSIEQTTTEKPLPPVPVLPEIKEELIEETEEEKIEKRAKAQEEADKIQEAELAEIKKSKAEVKEEKPKKKPKKEAAEIPA